MGRIPSPNWTSAANCIAADIAFACIVRIFPVALISSSPNGTRSSSCMAASGTGMPVPQVAPCRRLELTIGRRSSCEICNAIVPLAERFARPDGGYSSSGNVSLPSLVDREQSIGSFSFWTLRRTDIPRQRPRVLFGRPARPQHVVVPALCSADRRLFFDLLRRLSGGDSSDASMSACSLPRSTSRMEPQRLSRSSFRQLVRASSLKTTAARCEHAGILGNFSLR